jgi:hypothetical protein
MHEGSTKPIEVDAGGHKPPPEISRPQLGTVSLLAEHSTADFTSRSERVQQFIRSDCWTLISSNYTRVFVWPAPSGNKIWGFYSLSPFSVERKELNNNHQRKAPRGIPAPCALIGYMGKSADAPANFGAALIHDAALRASSITDMAFWGMCLHAENEDLAKWYKDKIHFTPAREEPLFMYAPFSALLG